MRIRMLHGVSGGVTLDPGDEGDFPNDEAIRMIEAGFAVPAIGKSVEVPEKPSAAIEKRAPAKRAKKPTKKK